MLTEALPFILIHLRNVMKHSSSNVCLSLWHSIPISVQRGCLEADILHQIWELFVAEMTPCGPYWYVYSVRRSSKHPCISKEGYETLEHQWISLLLAHAHIFHEEKVPKIWCFVWKFIVVFWQKWHSVDHKELADGVRSSFKHPHTSREGSETLKEQCIPLLATQPPIYCSE